MSNKTLKLKKRIIRNSFWSLINSILNKFGGLLFTILLARMLMPENYGVYSLVLSIALIAMTTTDLGINRTFVRYVSYALSKEKENIYSYYRYLLRLKLFLILITSAVLLILAYPLSFVIFRNEKLFFPLIVASFYIFIFSLEFFQSKIFLAIEKINFLTLREAIFQILRIILALLVFVFISSNYHIVGIFVSLMLVSGFLIIYDIYFSKKLFFSLFKKDKTIKSAIDKKSIRKFFGYLTLASISGVLFSYIDILILGFFVGTEYIGYYKAAFALILGIGGIIAFPNAALLPIFTKIEKSDSTKVFNKALRFLAILSIPAIFGILALGRYFIRFLFGEAYLLSAIPLYFLSIIIFTIVCKELLISLFSGYGKPEIFAKLMTTGLIMNIILNIILISFLVQISSVWAISGAAIATTTSWLFYLFVSMFILRKRLNMKLDFSPVFKSIIAGLVMFAVLVYSLKYIDMNFMWGIIEIIVGAGIYFFVLYLIKGISKEDFNVLLKALRK
jgi:O-antigen/teichoic acid export membrane protein